VGRRVTINTSGAFRIRFRERQEFRPHLGVKGHQVAMFSKQSYPLALLMPWNAATLTELAFHASSGHLPRMPAPPATIQKIAIR